MPIRPKIFFDTSACIDIARGKVSHSDWEALSNRLHRVFQYRISPLTVYELVSGLATGKQEHFDENKQALRIVYDNKRKFLPQLRAFVPSAPFKLTISVLTSVDADFDLWIKAVLAAPTRDILESGKLRVRHHGRCTRIGLSLDSVNKQMRDIQHGYTTHFRQFQHVQVPDLTPDVWADFMLKEWSLPASRENRDRVVDLLDAAYRFARALWDHAKDPNYRIEKHGSEIVDEQQLYYLCDPGIYFLTTDKRLRNRIANSSQIWRILSIDDLRQHFLHYSGPIAPLDL